MRNITETVKHLLIINGIFFLATLTLGNQVYDWFALHYPNNPKFEIWQPLTHMFMHGDISHIFFNMFGLWMFGTPLEQKTNNNNNKKKKQKKKKKKKTKTKKNNNNK